MLYHKYLLLFSSINLDPDFFFYLALHHLFVFFLLLLPRNPTLVNVSYTEVAMLSTNSSSDRERPHLFQPEA